MTHLNTGLIPLVPAAEACAPTQHFTLEGRRPNLEMYVEAPGEDLYDDEAEVVYDDGVLAIFYDGLEYTGLMTAAPTAGRAGALAPAHDMKPMVAARDALGLTLGSWAETDFGYTLYYSKH